METEDDGQDRSDSRGQEPTPGPSGASSSATQSREPGTSRRRVRRVSATISYARESSGHREPQESSGHREPQEVSNMNPQEDSNDTTASSRATPPRERLTTDEEDDDDEDHLLNHDPTPAQNPYPVPKWFSVNALQERELGRSVVPRNPRTNKRPTVNGFDPFWFRKHVFSSIYFLQRLELLERLEEHNGCVNSLDFNASGDLICSGSDDLQIAIWDWERSQLRHKYHSGHSSNVFQSKFCVDGNHIVSCARDGQVRICDVRNTTMTLSRKLVQHRNAAHKLSLTAPQVILSCGEDGVVFEIDLRMDKPSKILLVKESETKKVPLYSIHCSQEYNPEQFVVSGRSPFVHLYDRRFLTTAANSPAPLEKFCPTHLKTTNHTVTCAVFDSVGKSVLASYNDDDMYLFDSRNGELEHTYKGHRNSATVKGCSWFSDDFVLSGSDDGYIYGWDRETEHIVMSLYADENGVVNCLQPHPTCPFLATSGLDDNVKVWVPSSYQWPQTMKGIKQRICTNVRERKLEQKRAANDGDLDGVDSSMIWFIIRQLRQRHRAGGGSASHAVHLSSDEEDDEDDEDNPDRQETQQCIPS